MVKDIMYGYKQIMAMLGEQKKGDMIDELHKLLGFELKNISYVTKLEIKMLNDRLRELGADEDK